MPSIVLSDSVLPRNFPSNSFSDFEQSYPRFRVLLVHIFVYLFPILVPSSHLQLIVLRYGFVRLDRGLASLSRQVFVLKNITFMVYIDLRPLCPGITLRVVELVL